jgi:hypothetical protein
MLAFWVVMPCGLADINIFEEHYYYYYSQALIVQDGPLSSLFGVS